MIAICVVGLVVQKLSTQTTTETNLVELIQPNITSAQPQPQEITQKQQYLDYSASLKEIVKTQDPSFALQKIAKDLDSLPFVQQKCHSLTHIIGEATLQKYNNNTKKSLSFAKEVCGGGFVHGIIENFIETSNNPDKEIYEICESKDQTCLHGVGHGIMIYKKYDQNLSLKLCSGFDTETEKIRCSEGVFMELFDSDNSTDEEKPNLIQDDPSSICYEYKVIYQDSCYYYASRYIYKKTSDPILTLQNCQNIRTNDINGCIKGAGSAIIRANLRSPFVIEKYCPLIPTHKSLCFQSAVDYHIFILQNPEETKSNFCNKLASQEDKEICQEAIKKSVFR
jgi:hypothetical protein